MKLRQNLEGQKFKVKVGIQGQPVLCSETLCQKQKDTKSIFKYKFKLIIRYKYHFMRYASLLLVFADDKTELLRRVQ